MEYVQRRLIVPEEMGNRTERSDPSSSYGEELHALLFHPIAGDSCQSKGEPKRVGLPPLLCLKRLQFGLLDAKTMVDLSVAVITSPSCNLNPGCLNDLRMGAGVGGKACQTCGHHHHNCPGHFGRIQLPHPVINPLFVGLLIRFFFSVSQTTCLGPPCCRRSA